MGSYCSVLRSPTRSLGRNGGESGAVDLKAGVTQSTEIVLHQNHPFLRALESEKVSENLMRYLNFRDMILLSEVSKTCQNAVRKTKKFENNAVLVLWRSISDDDDFPFPMMPLSNLRRITYPWNNIFVDLSASIEIARLFLEIIEKAGFLSFGVSGLTSFNHAEVAQYIPEILKKADNLRELELDDKIMAKVIHYLSSVEGAPLANKLESLIIYTHRTGPQDFHAVYNLQCQDSSIVLLNQSYEWNNFRLKKLSVRLSFVPGFMHSIVNIAIASKDTLEDLELHLRFWSFLLEKIKSIQFPKLKRLILSGETRASPSIQEFITNQPPLEELGIELDKDFPVEVLRSLQGKLENMKRIHLLGRYLSGIEDPIDLTILESMVQLKEFLISMRYSYAYNFQNNKAFGDEILRKLPTTVEQIVILGVDTLYERETPHRGTVIGNLMGRLENLTRLKLTRAGYNYTVTDKNFQDVIRNCTKLTLLELTDCLALTDVGISGVRMITGSIVDHDSGISLTNLMGLNRLQLRNCPNLTPECLLRVVRFDFLRSFDYFRDEQMENGFALQIARQNPLLDELNLNMGKSNNIGLKIQLKHINPRLCLCEIKGHANWDQEEDFYDPDNPDYAADLDFEYDAGEDFFD